MSSRLCIILIVYLKILCVTCKGNSSLTFVIDDTLSMTEEIGQVIRGSRDLLDYVLKTKSSEIEDLVLVTFNDPDVVLRAKTKNKSEFIRALKNINVHNYHNYDCPEYSMKGIIRALEESRSDSYLYAFTDAFAKDFHRVNEVINLCEKKQSQVIFVLTGKCGYNPNVHNDVYNEIAKACSGSVITIGMREVHLAVETIKHFVNDKKTIITITTVEHKSYPIPVSFTLDEKIEHAIITVSGPDVQFDIRKSNKFHEPKLPTEKIMWTPNYKVVKLVNKNPGLYTAWVKGDGEVTIAVYGKTDLTFDYGFSEFVPKSLVDTSKQPITGIEHYLSISVRDPQHEVNIEKATIMSVDEKVLMELSLKKIGTDFYVTDHFVPPETTFKIAVKGTIIKTGKPIVRVSKISVQPRLPDAKLPRVTIKEGSKIEINYGSDISLTCEVSAYPKPTIQWVDSDRNVLDSQSSMIEFPYKYISNLKMKHIKRSKSYICKASNNLGTITNSIQINVISPIKWIVSLPAVTRAEYGKELKLKCLTHSSYPTETKWYFNGPQDKLLPSADGSELTIKDMDINVQGHYTCQVFLKDDPKIAESQTTRVEISDLAPPEVIFDSKQIAAPENTKAKFLCRIVKGAPRPKISWQYRKNDGSELISLHESSQMLTINNITLNHSGKYVCTGTNVFGNSTAVAELEVLKSPEILNDGYKHAHVQYNGQHVFTCRVIAHPSPTIIWKDELGNFVHSTKVTANENEFISRLDLQHIKKNGTFSCFAENSVGKSVRRFVVSVKPPITPGSKLNVVQEAKYGEEVKLKCDVTSKFPIERNWIVNRSKEFIKSDDKYSFTQDANELVIKFMDINLQGTYVCRVRLEEDPNIFVEKNITLFINDLAPPKLTTSKEVFNKTFVARCVITKGVPQPVVTWKFKGESGEFIDLGVKGEVLTINNIQRQHNGSYQCIGKNAIGTDKAILHLEIEESPKIVTKKTKYRGVVGDKILVISCNATGYPDPTIVWKNSNNEIIQAGPKYTIKGSSNILSLYILNLMENDTGKLICQAQNKVGTITKTFDVLVLPDVTEELGNKHNVYILENDSKDINCTLPDSDSHSLRWYKNGYLTNVTGTAYSIKKATVWDDGNYTCRANTDVGSVSETFVVDVGYKPTFEDVETSIDWYGDEDVVDCIVRAKPAAKVEWLIDGERSDIKEFEQRIHSWGKYTCKVINVHGVVEKTVTVTTSGCLINRKMEHKNNPPLIVNTNINVDDDVPLLNKNNYMYIETGHKMKLTCYKADKNTFSLFPDKDTIIAECDREDKFNSEGKTYKYSDLKCNKPLLPTVKTTEQSCINVDSKMIEVGFAVPNFVKIYEVCYDHKLRLPNFVYLKLYQHNLGNQEKKWTGKPTADAVKGTDYCGERSKCCYEKGQLIVADDVDIGPPQITPLVNLNAIRVWKPCEKENRMTWRKLEEAVRSLLLSYNSIQVWTGASYENVDVRREPRYLWKVLKASEDIIAVVIYVNTPEPKTEDIKCKKSEQISSELEIGDDPFTYLCSLEEFSTAFGVPMDTFSRK